MKLPETSRNGVRESLSSKAPSKATKIAALFSAALAQAACGGSEDFPFAEPTGPCDPKVRCVAAESDAAGIVDIEAVVDGVDACLENGYEVFLGASPVNIVGNNGDDQEVLVPIRDDRGLMSGATTQQRQVTSDGVHYLSTVQADARGWEVVAEGRTDAAMQAIDCTREKGWDDACERRFGSKEEADKVARFGRRPTPTGEPDITYDSHVVPKSAPNDCVRGGEPVVE